MNGKLAVNIDEEALFEVLATANFAAPPDKGAARRPPGVIKPTAEASWIFQAVPDPGNYTAASANAS